MLRARAGLTCLLGRSPVALIAHEHAVDNGIR